MSTPTTLAEAAHELAAIFELLTGLRPRVAISPVREPDSSMLIAVGYPGDEMVRAMQIEAFAVEKGERILHRSQRRQGQTVLAYFKVSKPAPATGGYHLSTVKPPRVVPGPERHRWLIKKLLPGQSTTCDKCGCVKKLTRDYETRYQLPGQAEVAERPACTG
jgi:hypothetical protein